MAMSSKEMKGILQHTNSRTLVYYQYGNSDQLDSLFIPYVAEVLGPTFRMFDQSVCFKNRTEKNKFNGVRPVGFLEGASIARVCVQFCPRSKQHEASLMSPCCVCETSRNASFGDGRSIGVSYRTNAVEYFFPFCS
jgi:hypothetical protein